MKPVALITGASQGLGRALADNLADRGYDLVLKIVPADVSEDAEGIAGRGLDRFGRVDVLINNASELGPSPMPPLEHHSWESLLRIMRVNVVAPIHLAQLVIPQMRARGSGLIINITSDAGVNAYPGWGGYGSSKAALEHASRVLARELSGSGVRVLVVDPGDMNTEMHRQAEPGVDLSHLPSPEAIAPAIAALLDGAEPFARVEAQRLEAVAS